MSSLVPPAMPEPKAERRHRLRWYIGGFMIVNIAVAAALVLATRGGPDDRLYRAADRIWPVLILVAILAPVLAIRYCAWYWQIERRRRQQLAELLEADWRMHVAAARTRARQEDASPREAGAPGDSGSTTIWNDLDRAYRDALALPPEARVALIESLIETVDRQGRARLALAIRSAPYRGSEARP